MGSCWCGRSKQQWWEVVVVVVSGLGVGVEEQGKEAWE